MSDQHRQDTSDGLARAIALAEAALIVCDENGFMFAAIDISAAIDKLKAIEASFSSTK
jgi:hypothetical protein